MSANVHPYDVIFIGLALDVVGAVILAKGFMLKHPTDMYYESLMIIGGNDHLVLSAFLQRAEALVGAILLVAGFLFQIWGNLHGGIAASQPGVINSIPRMLGVGVVAVIGGVVCLKVAHLWARKRFYALLFADYSPSKPLAPRPDDKTWVGRWSRLLGLRRRRGESDETFFARLQRRHEHLGKQFGPKGAPLAVTP